MPAGKTTAIHAQLGEALAAAQAEGHFRLVALADNSGLAWSVVGNTHAPDQLASVPALVARAFEDKQPLLRFFSQQRMRFEYHSDSLAYILGTVDGQPADTSFLLDVPSEKDSNEFVLAWGEGAFFVMRNFLVGGALWRLLGISPNPEAALAALKSAIPALSGVLEHGTRDLLPSPAPVSESTVREKLMLTLEAFREGTPGVQMAAVTSKDGFVVAALPLCEIEPEMVAPLIGHSYLAIQDATERLCGGTQTVMLRMDEGILLARELYDDLLFTAMLAPSACTGLVMHSFEMASSTLRIAVTSMASAVMAPEALEVAA